MNPLSITTAALSAAKACGLVSWELGKFLKDTKLTGTTIEMLTRDVVSFENILKVMHETVEHPAVKVTVGSTGLVGSFWNQILMNMKDAEVVLNSLRNAIARVNKNVTVLDSARKQLRLNLATDEIAGYQQQITSYKGTIEVLISTTICFQQATDKEATDKIIPRLDETQQILRQLVIDINNRMESIEESIKASPSPNTSSYPVSSKHAEHKTLDNLKSSLKIAASIMTSASTNFSQERSGRIGASSTVMDSDFGDIFPPDPNDLTLNWIETASGSEQLPRSRKGKTQAINELGFSDDVDTDDDELRQEMFQAFLHLSTSHIEQQQYKDAQRELQNCIDQISVDIITRKSSEIPSALLDTMSHLVKALLDQRRWDEAQKLLKEKLALLSRGPQRDENLILEDTLQFSNILFQKGEFTEGLLYAKKAERGYRKQKARGIENRKKALQLIIKILMSTENGKKDAEGYRAILESISPIKAREHPSVGDASARILVTSTVSRKYKEAISPRQKEPGLFNSTQSRNKELDGGLSKAYDEYFDEAYDEDGDEPFIKAYDQDRDEPEEDYDEPEEDYDEPEEDYDEPEEDYDEPEEDSVKPEEDYDEPEEDSVKPQGDYDKLDEDHDEPEGLDGPKEDHDEPEEDHDEPEEDHDEPEEGHDEPEEGHDEPEEDHDEPDNDDYDEPDNDDYDDFLDETFEEDYS